MLSFSLSTYVYPCLMYLCGKCCWRLPARTDHFSSPPSSYPLRICVFVFMFLCMCICVFVFMYLCIYICVFVFMCLCICVVSAVERRLPGLITSAHSHNRILYLAWFFAQFSKTKLDFAICMLLVCIGFITMNRSYLIYHHHNTCVQCFDQASAVLRISMLAAIAFSCVFPTDPNLIRCSARCW